MSPRYRHLLPNASSGFARSELQGGVIARLCRMAQRYALRPALRHGERTFTYAELEQGCATLAAVLRRKANTSNAPVALLLRHGVQAPLSQLAALWAGTCYACLDADLPRERLLRLMADLQARLLLYAGDTREHALVLASASGTEALDVDAVLAGGGETLTPLAVPPTTPAYIVYTSGSTGAPQGVMVSHENVLHYCWSHTRYMHINADDRVSQFCPLWTAAGAAEIFATLLNGATLYPGSVTRDGPAALVRLLQRERLTLLCAVPVVFRLLLEAAPADVRFPAMRLLRLAGDRTTRRDLVLFRRHFNANCLLRVGLGASECLLYAHHFLTRADVLKDEIVPVGYPLADMELLLLDESGRPVPQGEYGEIAVRSRYLSLGYWRNPTLTAQRFPPDPSGNGQRLYLSRDIGYVDAQGLLHHVGRSDSRVKLHGRMVLMSDVEAALLALPSVREAVVVPYDSGAHGTELAAFVVAPGQRVEELRRGLAKRLPPALLPRRLTLLDALPLQLNNKINRLRLKALCS